MLDAYRRLNKQVILTSTLKKEEYSTAKYPKTETVNPIDYSAIATNKLLQSTYCP